MGKKPYLFLVYFCLSWWFVPGAQAYDAKTHQQLTFLAAKQFNRCAAAAGVLPLTPLQVRYVAKYDAKQSQQGFFSRLFRWNFYNRDRQHPRSFMWVFNTRMHAQYNDLLSDLNRPRRINQQYATLGRAVSYIQSMTSPVHVVPIYYARFWRFSVSDRFDNYPVDIAAVETDLSGDCRDVTNRPNNLEAVLKATADDTIAAIHQPIDDLPATWQVFWKFSRAKGAFGDYGKVGNSFARKVKFRCQGRKCELQKNDVRYRRFANARHTHAVKSTIAAMGWLQHQLAPRLLSQN